MVSAHHAVDARLWPEMEEQSHFQIGSSYLVVDLARCEAVQFVGGFDLYDQSVLHYHIQPFRSEDSPLYMTLTRSSRAMECHRTLSSRSNAIE